MTPAVSMYSITTPPHPPATVRRLLSSTPRSESSGGHSRHEIQDQARVRRLNLNLPEYDLFFQQAEESTASSRREASIAPRIPPAKARRETPSQKKTPAINATSTSSLLVVSMTSETPTRQRVAERVADAKEGIPHTSELGQRGHSRGRMRALSFFCEAHGRARHGTRGPSASPSSSRHRRRRCGRDVPKADDNNAHYLRDSDDRREIHRAMCSVVKRTQRPRAISRESAT